MPPASQIKAEIEAALAQRIPSALTPPPRSIRPTAATGIAAIDVLLGGGLPVGAISEIVGPECSGRTSLTFSFLANLTRQGKVCAWIDVSDNLHPVSAAAANVDLDRLLWVRCGAAEPPTGLSTPAKKTVATPLASTRVQLGGNSPHPRSESNGLPSAIGDLLGIQTKHKLDRITGTPGAPNRSLSSTTTARPSREEQVASDRLPARRGPYVLEQREPLEPCCSEPRQKPRPAFKTFPHVTLPSAHMKASAGASVNSWSRLSQALRVTDLLLQAGGFNAIVLDMGSITPEHALRVPVATWFRYRAAAERTHSSFILLTQRSCAKNSAALLLNLDVAQPREAGPTIFSGFVNQAEMSRQRFEQGPVNVVLIRKPVRRETKVEWNSRTAWAGQR